MFATANHRSVTLSPHDQDTLTVPGVGYDRDGKGRARKPPSRIHPYQYRDTRRPSWTRDSMGHTHLVGSNIDPPLVAESSSTNSGVGPKSRVSDDLYFVLRSC